MLLLSLLGLVASAADLPDVDSPLRTGAHAATDAAVVIGIEQYAFVADVPYASRDARAFYDFLVYTRGVPADQIRLFEGAAGREQIVEALHDAAGHVRTGGKLWVYFAGHGAADTSSGERLLLGDDVRQDPTGFTARAVSLAEVREIAGHTELVLITDACYNGLGRGGEEIVSGKRFVVPAQVLTPSGTATEWTAAGADELSGPLEAVEHGAFTYFAIGAMRGWADGELDGARDGKVTAEEADLFVKRALRTVQINDQHPVLSTGAASSLVLSVGTEAAPDLSAGPGSASMTAPTPTDKLDASDAALMDEVVQGIVDRCTDQNRTPSVSTDNWYIRFKTKKGIAKGMMIGDANVSASDYDTEVDPGFSARSMCIRRELKLLQFSPTSAVVVRTLTPTEP